MMAMSNRDKKGKRIFIHLFVYLFIHLYIYKCTNEIVDENSNYFVKTQGIISKTDYFKVYSLSNDTLISFKKNLLGSYNFLSSGQYWLDSLMCFDNSASRLISCVLSVNTKYPEVQADAIQFIYGEKIQNNWYFFKGPSIVIPRSMVKGHPINQPLSYAQLHQIALKEVYGGYLKSDGSINEAWFTSHFEDIGWGDFNDQTSSLKYLGLKPNEKFTDKRKFFEAIHLQSVKNNWYQWWKQDSIKKSKENFN